MKDNIYNPDYVRKLFNAMSGSYEQMNYITSFGFSLRWRKQFLNALTPTNEKVRVIDLLTGMGETWKGLKQKLPNSELVVLDFSEGMLKYAQQKSRTRFDNKVQVLQQDVLQNSLPDQGFDYVTCAFGLKTFNEEQLGMLAAETKRILKPGGQFSFIEVSKPDIKALEFCYGLYLGYIIPVLGKLFLGSPEEYRMLWKYTKQFKNSKAAMELFEKTGLNVNFHSYFYGCATGFSGYKPVDLK